MNTLPQQPSTDQSIGLQPVSSIGMGKEVEHIEKSAVEIPTDGEHSKDTELPKEVSAVGGYAARDDCRIAKDSLCRWSESNKSCRSAYNDIINRYTPFD